MKISRQGRWVMFLAWRTGVIPFRVFWWALVSSTYELAMARSGLNEAAQRRAKELSKQDCECPPAGWRCTRMRGHSGPCAAVKL